MNSIIESRKSMLNLKTITLEGPKNKPFSQNQLTNRKLSFNLKKENKNSGKNKHFEKNDKNIVSKNHNTIVQLNNSQDSLLRMKINNTINKKDINNMLVSTNSNVGIKLPEKVSTNKLFLTNTINNNFNIVNNNYKFDSPRDENVDYEKRIQICRNIFDYIKLSINLIKDEISGLNNNRNKENPMNDSILDNNETNIKYKKLVQNDFSTSAEITNPDGGNLKTLKIFQSPEKSKCIESIETITNFSPSKYSSKNVTKANNKNTVNRSKSSQYCYSTSPFKKSKIQIDSNNKEYKQINREMISIYKSLFKNINEEKILDAERQSNFKANEVKEEKGNSYHKMYKNKNSKNEVSQDGVLKTPILQELMKNRQSKKENKFTNLFLNENKESFLESTRSDDLKKIKMTKSNYDDNCDENKVYNYINPNSEREYNLNNVNFFNLNRVKEKKRSPNDYHDPYIIPSNNFSGSPEKYKFRHHSNNLYNVQVKAFIKYCHNPNSNLNEHDFSDPENSIREYNTSRSNLIPSTRLGSKPSDFTSNILLNKEEKSQKHLKIDLFSNSDTFLIDNESIPLEIKNEEDIIKQKELDLTGNEYTCCGCKIANN